ncbi:MAG TPA: histidine phosphatase family protein [Acidimicrobiia bacterium]
MAALVHLVRHAEVDNPHNLVVGSTPGFGLSPYGVEQARRVGRYLGPRAVVAIWSSPLEPALRTAEEIAARSSVPVRVDEDLRDWSITDRWEGHPWSHVSATFPGELEAYLADPWAVDLVDETLAEVADRVAAVARRLDSTHPHGDVVIVTHQDAMQAGRIRLVGSDRSRFHQDLPGPGTVVTLRPGPAWREETSWTPGESPRFGEKSDLRVVQAENPTPSPA